jgi:type I restriction enzyme S subunit
MSEWKTARLSEIADVRVSNVDKKSLPHEPAVKLCNYMDVYSNDYITSDLAFMEATAAPSQIERFKVQVGDVMITKDSETPEDIGIPAVVTESIPDLVCGYHLALIKPDSKQVDGRYLAKQLGTSTTANYYARQAAGSTRYGLSNGTINDTPIPLVSLPQQRRIATILTTLDEEIEATEALIAKHQQIKAGLMHDLFTRGLWTQAELARGDHKGLPCEATAKEGHLRPTPEEAPGLYQDSKVGLIPLAWKRSSIAEVADSLADGPFGSNLKTEHYVTEPGVRVVRLQNIQTTRYNDDDRAFISESHANYLSRNQVVPGDILIAGLGEDRHVVARACCYPDDLPPAINKADCFRMRCKSDQALNAFVMLFLNTSAAREQVRCYEQGVTRLRINGGNLKRLHLGLPGLDEQTAIVSRIEAASRAVDEETTHFAKLRQQKQGLMHDLLTGRVRVNGGK